MVERIIVGLLHTNAYIFSTGKKDCLIIDPGADPLKIIQTLSALNMIPRGIVFTHGHLDHTAAAGKIVSHYAAITGESIPVAIHEADRTFLGSTAEHVNREHFSYLGPEENLFNRLYHPLPPADVLLKDGEYVFGTELRVIHTPGHTSGSICLYTEVQSILFTGDTVFFKGIGRTDLPGGDEYQLLESVRGKIFTLPPDTRLFPGHGPNTVLEREKNHNIYMPHGTAARKHFHADS